MDLQTILTAVAIPVGGAALGLAGKWILSGQKDIKELIDRNHTGIDKRVIGLEQEARQFMPKTDLAAAFEHEKSNRMASDQAAAILIGKNADDIIRIREHVARLDQNDTYLTSQIGDLKAGMDKGFDKMDGKLGKIADCVAALDKKVG